MLMNRVFPHVAVPGVLTPQTQEVPFEKYVGSFTNYADLGDEKAYITLISNINTETHVGQQWPSDMAKQTYTMGQIAASYYKISAMVEYNVDEQAKFEKLAPGLSLKGFLEDMANQGIEQRRHQAILFGFDAAEPTQGIMGNSTAYTWAADSNGIQTLIGYDVAELQAQLSTIVREVMNTSYGMLKPAVIASSSRVINYLKTAIIPLVSGQKDGGGIDSVAGVFGKISGEWLGVGRIEFIEDNLLMDADLTDTANPKDVILVVAPGLDQQTAANNMNRVGRANSISYNTWVDAIAGDVLQFDAPPTLGTFQSRFVTKMTPGVTLRSESVVKTSIKYA